MWVGAQLTPRRRARSRGLDWHSTPLTGTGSRRHPARRSQRSRSPARFRGTAPAGPSLTPGTTSGSRCSSPDRPGMFAKSVAMSGPSSTGRQRVVDDDGRIVDGRRGGVGVGSALPHLRGYRRQDHLRARPGHPGYGRSSSRCSCSARWGWRCSWRWWSAKRGVTRSRTASSHSSTTRPGDWAPPCTGRQRRVPPPPGPAARSGRRAPGTCRATTADNAARPVPVNWRPLRPRHLRRGGRPPGAAGLADGGPGPHSLPRVSPRAVGAGPPRRAIR